MKILLNKIKYYITEENRFGFRNHNELPSNILTTASFLEGKGFDVDVKVQDYFLEKDFNNYDFFVAWVSIADGFYESIDYLRTAKLNGLKTILVLFDDWSDLSRQILEEFDFIDFAVRRWDIEHNLMNILNIFKKKKHEKAGFVSRLSTGEIKDFGEKIYNTKSLDHLGSSRKWIKKLGVENFDEYSVRASSGCLFKCTFCHIGKRTNRYRKISDFIDELKVFPKYSNVKFLSADLLANKEWVTNLANEIINNKIKIRWMTDSRFNWFDDLNFLKLIEKSGCKRIDVGLESFNNKILKSYKKAYNTDFIQEKIINICKTNITLGINMMIGNPEDDLASINQTCEFLKQIPKKQIKLLGVQYLRPLPGTEIYNSLIKSKVISKAHYKDFIHSRHEPFFIPSNLTYNTLVQGRKMLEESYLKY